MEKKKRKRKKGSISLTKKEISFLYSKGNKYHGLEFIVFYKKNNLSLSRVAISISKKSGGAPFRNSVKRRVKSLLQFFNFPGYDLVFSCRRDISSSFFLFKHDISSFFKKVNKN